MDLKKLLVAGVVFYVTAKVTDEIMKDFDLPPETKYFVSRGVGAAVGAVAHLMM